MTLSPMTPKPKIPLYFHPGMRTQDIRIAHRVVARYLYGTEFATEEALKDYLHEHPDADPRNHSVAKPKKEKAKGEEESNKGGKKPSLKERLQALTGHAKALFEAAPKAVQNFIHDPEARKATTDKAAKALKDAPGKIVKNALHNIKHEAKEWKVAGQGVHAVLTGKELSKEQKHALKTIAIDIAITVSIVALTGGLAAGAAGLAKKTALSYAEGLAKKVALNAVTGGLGNLVTLQELYHGAHGATHLFSELMSKLAADAKAEGKGKPSEEEALGYWVAGLVAKQLGKGVTDDDALSALAEVT